MRHRRSHFGGDPPEDQPPVWCAAVAASKCSLFLELWDRGWSRLSLSQEQCGESWQSWNPVRFLALVWHY